MDITERTPLIQPATYPTVNSRYIPKIWSRLLKIIITLDFLVHMFIYIVSFFKDSRSSFYRINNLYKQFNYYDYLIISSIRVSILFSFCYVKKLIKFHIPIIVTIVS